MLFDRYDILLVNRMGNLVDEGWSIGPGGPYIDFWKAHEAVSTRYGYPQPRVIETFEKAGVLIRDVERGVDYIDTQRVLELRPYLANKLNGAPDKVPVKRSAGMVPRPWVL